MKKNKILLVILTILLLLPLSGCKKQEEVKIDPKGMSYYDFFDTVSFIYSYTSDDNETFETKCNAVADILEEYHVLFDIYNEYEGINNLATINLNAGIKPIEVDEKLITFLLQGKELYYMTNGKMNIMIGALTRPWHDAREFASENPKEAYLPNEEELVNASKHIDIESLIIDQENNTVYISDPDSLLDVGAFGKGYATERAADYLFEINSLGYVLNIGGNIRIIGTKVDGTGWVTGIINPNNKDEFALRVNLSNTACVTSGNYERYFTVNGVRYHHVIDSDTLYPSNYFASVTIICEDSGLADALSTALYCMSYEDGLELCEKYNFGAIWIYTNGDIKSSKNIENLIY